MRFLETLSRRWNGLTLALQFIIAGGFGLLAVMLVVGFWVTAQIRESVLHNSAATTALYVDSVIAPLLPDLRTNHQLDDAVKRALDETLGQGALGKRLFSFKLWRRDGTVLYSKDTALIGRQFGPSANLRAAFAGNVVAEFNELGDEDDKEERAAGVPLLEIYNPVREPWSGEVVAVTEFYEIADDFQAALASALLSSWLIVAGATLTALLLLSGIVIRGSRTIDKQRGVLQGQVSELQALVSQNRALRLRVQQASRRATALNERYLRRIGADLHDGPAQLVALAALRVDSPAISGEGASSDSRNAEIAMIRMALDDAMREIRGICNGLVLPQIETAATGDILRLAVDEHQRRTRSSVALTLSRQLPELGASEKISIYRFVQEGLNNAYRHGQGKDQEVKAGMTGGKFFVEVSDGGPGFDPRRAEGLGLAGIRERIESIGGQFETTTGPQGTRLMITLAVEDQP
ncbi:MULTISPECIES: sensor histidine kinase [unclassified Mesorhizobium]|uniref:sensor histidine kinase n=1 Tax=unclassified Mesorhizobium TaxID=325217 RepID=UPI00112AF039|nr:MULTISPECIES: sensor histidine kinase [unclassified Mesorhizobium]TPJ49839.1 sensor histidine kinase [Mesorhizobium sp. B2-6-6]MBZ9702130.1 sensor histidine kinase [Mesorhizobium sp. CO1-1-3]MBZ9893401.1 sensor histidine kinase [Mesorhizobium sp. BR1-1-6]MBZ9920610.1 sensor histidine kinase [Mesorhizobium sp. BR1-1-7]MBZ9947216.1 sensor histidine kinase [Mesorhizobium sp. BR1-1-11]